ncbi:MAG: MFS transporter [Rubricoccaceae bacterium]
MASLRERAGEYPRTFWMLVVGTFINRTGLVVVPFLALFLTLERGMTIPQGTAAVSLYGAGAFAGGFLGGWLSDHVGRRAVMLLSLGGGALLVGALPFAPGFLTTLAAAFGFGMLGEMYRPAVTAAVADLVPEERQPEAYAIVYWAINLGAAIGPALGGLIATYSYLGLFVLDGATMLAYALVVWVAIPETRPDAAADTSRQPVRLDAALRDGPLVGIALATLFVGLGFYQLFTSLPLTMTADGLSELDFGLIVSINGGLIVLIGLPVAAWAGNRMLSWTLPASVALIAIGLAMYAPAHTFGIYALGAIVWTVGEMAFLPVVPTLVSRLAPVHLRGSYQGVYHGGWGLAKMLGPLLGGLVLAAYGAAALWYAAAGLVGLAALGLAMLLPVLRHRLTASS